MNFDELIQDLVRQAAAHKSAQLKKKKTTTSASAIYDDSTVYSTLEKDDKATFEEQLVMRFPERYKNAVQQSIESGNIVNDMEVVFFDERHGKINFKGNHFKATLVDLPCIIESFKTQDSKQYYKIADICQMIIVSEESEPPISMQDIQAYPSGLTPPMSFVRSRRFRKPVMKPSQESSMSTEDMEKMVQKLLEADERATQVSYEFKHPKDIEELQGSAGLFGEDDEFLQDDDMNREGMDLFEEEEEQVSDFAAELEDSLFTT